MNYVAAGNAMENLRYSGICKSTLCGKGVTVTAAVEMYRTAWLSAKTISQRSPAPPMNGACHSMAFLVQTWADCIDDDRLRSSLIREVIPDISGVIECEGVQSHREAIISQWAADFLQFLSFIGARSRRAGAATEAAVRLIGMLRGVDTSVAGLLKDDTIRMVLGIDLSKDYAIRDSTLDYLGVTGADALGSFLRPADDPCHPMVQAAKFMLNELYSNDKGDDLTVEFLKASVDSHQRLTQMVIRQMCHVKRDEA